MGHPVYPCDFASLLQFWESTIVWRTYSGSNESYPRIEVTDFRVHPTYARYVTWSKLVVQCLLPMALLVFFNRSETLGDHTVW